MAQLIFYKQEEPLLQRSLDQDQIVIGRDAACEIQLFDPEISRQHCTLSRQAGSLLLEDTSRNGTFINQKRIDKAALRPGDVIAVG